MRLKPDEGGGGGASGGDESEEGAAQASVDCQGRLSCLWRTLVDPKLVILGELCDEEGTREAEGQLFLYQFTRCSLNSSGTLKTVPASIYIDSVTRSNSPHPHPRPPRSPLPPHISRLSLAVNPLRRLRTATQSRPVAFRIPSDASPAFDSRYALANTAFSPFAPPSTLPPPFTRLQHVRKSVPWNQRRPGTFTFPVST